jgi:hypothetical protein
VSAAESMPAGARKIASKARPPVKPAERVWQLFTVLGIAGLGWWYYTAHRQPSPNRYHDLVLALGWTGIASAVLAAMLSARKRIAYQGAGRMSVWLTAHVYLGVLSACAILLHSGLRAGGPLSAWLLGFFSLTVASGLMGWWFSRKLPPLLTQMEERPAIMEDLLLVRAECLQGMLELAAGGSPEFRGLVEHKLMPDASSWGRMLRFYRRRSNVSEELPAFQKEHAEELSSLKRQEQVAYQRAIEYALRVNKMNAEILLQRAMRGWLTLHIVCTGTMFGLAAIHIFTQLYF